jgi:enamine deaminase RidA (YjgF/YER057c/UK114 family)
MEIKRLPTVIARQNQPYAKGTAALGTRGYVFLSGSVGINKADGDIPESITEQTKLALTNIKERLEEYGSSLEYILHEWVYLKGQFPYGIVNNPGWQKCSSTLEEFWGENCPSFLLNNVPPARTLLGVTSLAREEFKVEIQVIAAVP